MNKRARGPRLERRPWETIKEKTLLFKAYEKMETINPMNPRHDDNPLCGAGFDLHIPDLHSSGITMYQRCPREFMFSEMFHFQPKGYYSSALNLGTLYHILMAELFSKKSFHQAEEEAARKVAGSLETLMEDADSVGILPNGDSVDRVHTSMIMDLQKATAMAAWVWFRAPFPPPDDKSTWEVIDVERHMTHKTEYGENLRGTLDLILRRMPQDEFWIVDHKTTSFDPSMMSMIYSYDVQPKIYRRLAREAYGIDPTGVIHNVVLKPDIRLKKNQTMAQYIDEIHHWYEGTERHSDKAEARKKHPAFIRSRVHFDKGEDEEVDRQIAEVGTASRCQPRLAVFPRHAQSCIRYRSLCPYAPFCTQNKVKWPHIAETKFHVRHRDDDHKETSDG